jgi:hypothetical protein
MADAQKLRKRFLKALCKIKGWPYNANIEIEKGNEIKEFIEKYILNEQEHLPGRITYNRLRFLIKHSDYTSLIFAVVAVLELSDERKRLRRTFS